MNEDEQESGGIHLFEDGAALDACLNSEIVVGIVGHPALSGFSVKQFDVMEDLSKFSRAPLETAVVA